MTNSNSRARSTPRAATHRARVYFSLGTNLGDRMANLARAIAALRTTPGVDVRAVSPIYETAPVGDRGAPLAGQPAYLNCAVCADVTTPPAALREQTVAIERAIGRGDHGRWQPRLIDIDLVLYGDVRLETSAVTVPHPRMTERAFVLRPLVDLDPDLTAPGIGRLADLLPAVADQRCDVFARADELPVT